MVAVNGAYKHRRYEKIWLKCVWYAMLMFFSYKTDRWMDISRPARLMNISDYKDPYVAHEHKKNKATKLWITFFSYVSSCCSNLTTIFLFSFVKTKRLQKRKRKTEPQLVDSNGGKGPSTRCNFWLLQPAIPGLQQSQASLQQTRRACRRFAGQ